VIELRIPDQHKSSYYYLKRETGPLHKHSYYSCGPASADEQLRASVTCRSWRTSLPTLCSSFQALQITVNPPPGKGLPPF